MIKYTETKELSIEDLLPLYRAVGWTNYTDRPDMLAKAYAHSLFTLAAFDGQQLVGLIRSVGDGASCLFIQDLLVLPAYQRQGIGRQLVSQTLEKFKDVYQIQLVTETTDKNLAFYRSLGFHLHSDFACTGMIYVGENENTN